MSSSPSLPLKGPLLRRYFGIADGSFLGAAHCPADPTRHLTIALLDGHGAIMATALADAACQKEDLPADCGFAIPIPAAWLESTLDEQVFSFRIIETGTEFPTEKRIFSSTKLQSNARQAAATPVLGWNRGRKFTTSFPTPVQPTRDLPSASANPLERYFDAHLEGHGIWKWRHYFAIYHRHLAKFIGTDAHLMEVGIYSGGSLGMWLDYLGPTAQLYGVDIEEACRSYASERCQVFIGDQADPSFWKNCREAVPRVDILIDDGGHTPEQQMVTLEQMLAHLSPGGVYICEDVHGDLNEFTDFVSGLITNLNTQKPIPGSTLASSVTPWQSAIYSVHWYPYLVVIEKNAFPCPRLEAPKHGTSWQPFL